MEAAWANLEDPWRFTGLCNTSDRAEMIVEVRRGDVTALVLTHY